MRKKLSFLVILIFSVGIASLLSALFIEISYLFPPQDLKELSLAYYANNLPPDSFIDKLQHRISFYLYLIPKHWPLFGFIALGCTLGYILSLILINKDQTKTYLNRIHLLESRLDRKEKEFTKESDEHVAFMARIDAMYQQSPEAYVLVNSSGYTKHLNPTAERFFAPLAGKESLLINRHIRELIPSFVDTGLERLFKQIVEKKAVWQGEIQLQHTAIFLSLKIIYAGDDGVIVIFRDVSRDRAETDTLKTSDALVQQILHNAPEPMVILDSRFRIQKASATLESITGNSISKLRNMPINDIFLFSKFSTVQHDLENGKSFHRNEEMFKIAGKECWFKWSIHPWHDSESQHGGYLLFMEDVSDFHNIRNRVESKEEAEHALAYQDALTGLPNRQLFNDRLNMALAQAYRQLGRIALFFLDLDGFKAINDNLGHEAGDILLKEVANRLVSCVRKTDTVARLGGDEFTIILWIREPKDAEIVANKIIEAINKPYVLNGKEAFVSTSIGISMYPLHGEGAAELIRKADTAMYSAKTSGKNQYVYYNDQLNQAGE